MTKFTRLDLNVCFPTFLNIKHLSYTVHSQTIFTIVADEDKTDLNIPTNIRLSAHKTFYVSQNTSSINKSHERRHKYHRVHTKPILISQTPHIFFNLIFFTFYIIFKGYLPFTIITKYWLHSPCCTIHPCAYLIPRILYHPLPPNLF